jgi:hypothetical protein
MLESLWSIEIMTPAGGVGVGVILFVTRGAVRGNYRAGMVLGGDGRYYFAGTYAVEGTAMTGEMDVVHYAGEPYPAFGSEPTVRLTLSCELDPDAPADGIELLAKPLGEAGGAFFLSLTRRVEFD